MRNLRQRPLTREEEKLYLDGVLDDVFKRQGIGSLAGYALRCALEELHYLRFAREYHADYGLDDPSFTKTLQRDYEAQTGAQVPPRFRED